MKIPSKEEIKLSVAWKDHTDIVLNNHHGDTYTSQSEELHDFVTRSQDPLENSTPAPQSGEVMTLEVEIDIQLKETEVIKSFVFQWMHDKGFNTDDMCIDSLEFSDVFEVVRMFSKTKADQLQAELEQVKAEREWISVDHRLPKGETNVLTRLVDELTADVSIQITRFGVRKFVGIYDPAERMRVTHWMPLPSAPKALQSTKQ